MERYWDDDFARIKDSGLHAVQLWVLWSWVESEPGTFRFDDYDRLVALAAKHGLGVVLSTIAEVQPYWIHAEVPGSEMVDHLGRKVISSNRIECHFGLTPGGCFDHPGVWFRMQRFLEETASRYSKAEPVLGWDAWNELRWNVQADGLVCFCEHTLAAFRNWLEEVYGNLDGLNRAWKRRYGAFKEVLPGKSPQRPYTEMMAFEHFLTVRADRHAKARYDVIKKIDPNRPVTVHGAVPSPLMPGGEQDHAVNRGNDWSLADHLDGVGCSSFPKWQGLDDADFGTRVELVKSAANGKQVWLSEVQGGRAAQGFRIFQPVDALSQQRWVWNGIACGADMILFWCWRDEVFGHESAGFGLSGRDGLAGERIQAMKRSGRIIEENRVLIEEYQPSKPEVGILFSPQSYYLYWAQEGTAGRAMNALMGYARSLVRNSIPYTIVEETHLDNLDDLRILFLPRTIVMSPGVEETLERFVRAGGTLVCESECGAFNPQGIYSYPEDRFLARLTGVHEIGRRPIGPGAQEGTIRAGTYQLDVSQWLTPFADAKGNVLAQHKDGPLVVETSVGKGRVILCGAYLGDAYYQNRGLDFERLVADWVAGAGCVSEVEVSPAPSAGSASMYVKTGESNGRKLAFVFFPDEYDEATLTFRTPFSLSGTVRDLITGKTLPVDDAGEGQKCKLTAGEWRFAVLTP